MTPFTQLAQASNMSDSKRQSKHTVCRCKSVYYPTYVPCMEYVQTSKAWPRCWKYSMNGAASDAPSWNMSGTWPHGQKTCDGQEVDCIQVSSSSMVAKHLNPVANFQDHFVHFTSQLQGCQKPRYRPHFDQTSGFRPQKNTGYHHDCIPT